MGTNMGNQETADLPVKVNLPDPEASGMSRIEELIAKRRSIRRYKDKRLSESVISRLLWAVWGF